MDVIRVCTRNVGWIYPAGTMRVTLSALTWKPVKTSTERKRARKRLNPFLSPLLFTLQLSKRGGSRKGREREGADRGQKFEKKKIPRFGGFSDDGARGGGWRALAIFIINLFQRAARPVDRKQRVWKRREKGEIVQNGEFVRRRIL